MKKGAWKVQAIIQDFLYRTACIKRIGCLDTHALAQTVRQLDLYWGQWVLRWRWGAGVLLAWCSWLAFEGTRVYTVNG